MITNKSLTIYHREKDGFNRVYISNVSFYVDHKVNVSDAGISSAEVYKVRIPVEWLDGYLNPDDYKTSETGWTVDNGDYFVTGEGPEITKPSELGRNYAQVRGWSDNRRGGLPHLRIEGW